MRAETTTEQEKRGLVVIDGLQKNTTLTIDPCSVQCY